MERRCYGLDVIYTRTDTGKDFWYLIDDNGNINAPVFTYLKHLAINKSSKYTIRNDCFDLKHYFEWLKLKNYDYIEVVGKKSETNKGCYENLVDFKLYLAYPTLNDKVIPVDGFKQVRKDSYINQIMYTVLSFYKFLEEQNIVESLPVISQMKRLQHSSSMLREMYMSKQKAKKYSLTTKVEEEPIRFISEDEFNLCWEKCTTRRNRVIIGLMFYGGLRVSEVVGLNIGDLRDIYMNVIHITKRIDPDNIDAAVKYNSVRDVVVDDRLRDEIIHYLNEDLKGIDTNYFIINFKGKNKYGPMRKDTIGDMLDGLKKKVQLPFLHAHMFRHGCAMRMLYAGMDMIEISDKLGHKSIQTTAQTYARYDLKKKIETQQKLSDKLKQDFQQLDIDFDEIAAFLKEDDYE